MNHDGRRQRRTTNRTIPERWRPVKNFENKYAVSDWGRVRELIEPGKFRILEPHIDVANGARVYLKGAGGKRVSHLVLEAFVGPRPPDHVACHGDDHPTNNQLANLRWGTHRDNHQDSLRNRFGSPRSHCNMGIHPWIPENVGRNGPNGGEYCRRCRNDRQNKERKRKRFER
jgi:HNH endonuclease/NUMOD4 motif